MLDWMGFGLSGCSSKWEVRLRSVLIMYMGPLAAAATAAAVSKFSFMFFNVSIDRYLLGNPSICVHVIRNRSFVLHHNRA